MSFDPPAPPFNASDPSARFVSSSAFELLLIELVPLANRMAREAADALSQVPSDSTKQETKDAEPVDEAVVDEQEQEHREAVFYRLEKLGYRVGQGLAERFSRDRPRLVDTLDVIKFLCKDLWTLVFRKQIDNLKTNHRGVFVLTDNSFRPLTRMSMESGAQAVIRAQPFLYFPCGIIRGTLASMGINATVHAETSQLPGATFQIKTINAKS